VARIADAREGAETPTEKVAFRGACHDAEAAIDLAEEALPPLKNFVIPAGPNGGAAHLARTVCRRAERRLVALAATENVPAVFLAYLNRLSDLLFRPWHGSESQAGVPETPW